MNYKVKALSAIALLTLAISTLSTMTLPAYAAHTGITSDIYGIRAQACGPTMIDKFDPTTDLVTSYSLTSTGGPAGYCNGRGLAWNGTNLWYSVVAFGGTAPSFTGDGLIHKVGPTGGADLGTIPDPYGVGGRGVGALDFAGGFLWGISYLPVDNLDQIFKLDPATGTVLASCNIPFRGGGVGSDTFAIYGSGQMATDGGEVLTTVYFYTQPTIVNQGDCVQTQFVTLLFGVTGLDFDSANNCVATNLVNIYNLGGSSCNTSVSSQLSVFPGEEDLTATSTSTPPPPGQPPTNEVPEFGAPSLAVLAVAYPIVLLLRKVTRPTIG